MGSSSVLSICSLQSFLGFILCDVIKSRCSSATVCDVESSTERRRADDRAVIRTETTAGVRKRRIERTLYALFALRSFRIPDCHAALFISEFRVSRVDGGRENGRRAMSASRTFFRVSELTLSIDDLPYSTAYQAASDRTMEVLLQHFIGLGCKKVIT